ncbi:uncharacterized protein LOC127264453 [Andrographis paniculata]|uniref:uncharacterized protein LOC127264453 n=1 Tax=Andrographis paniculata TaxID=175694 RepID=UPI0021E91189|nr:uncharacterized protein LOC127264453 [Andrographis paniculata]
MPEMGFQDSRSGLRARDVSPDSVIFTTETNFSLFSSASASVERCSFASDVPDQDSISSHLAGHELSDVIMSGPDPDPNKSTTVHKNNSIVKISRKEKAKDSSEAETTEDETLAVDSARSSFSQALRECQDRRLRSEILLRKTDRRRPASLDLNSSAINPANSASPRFGIMKKPSASARKTGTFPSPGTPNYRHTSVGIQKGWSSERIPSHTNANRRSMNAVFLPYNNGRTLPSKWEDAERWIFSPVLGDGSAARASFQQPQRRPKSKSGPLGPPGVAYYQMFSPAAPMFNDGNKLAPHSPFSAGVIAVSGSSTQYGPREGAGNFLTEPCMARSISIHGCSEMLGQSSLPVLQDGTNGISRAVSRRDMATQMSPESSIESSPRRLSSFSLATPSIQPVLEFPSTQSSKQEIRDVSVDELVTVTRWSKRYKGKAPEKSSQNADDWKRKAISIHSTGWDVSTETSKSISKIQREEAKIMAWENLQKAKAEAAIRKLEMKLEKKRAWSMNKIMKKLRSAQKKAQDMRSSMLANPAGDRTSRPFERALSFRRTRPIGSLSGCFTCHAF